MNEISLKSFEPWLARWQLVPDGALGLPAEYWNGNGASPLLARSENGLFRS